MDVVGSAIVISFFFMVTSIFYFNQKGNCVMLSVFMKPELNMGPHTWTKGSVDVQLACVNMDNSGIAGNKADSRFPLLEHAVSG